MAPIQKDLLSKPRKITLGLLGLALVIWHIWSLSYSPLPWFDETFFASITNSLLHGKGFLLEVCPMQTHQEQVLTYGPVYFATTAMLSKILGFGIMSFRIVNLFAGFVAVGLFFKIIYQLQLPSRILGITLLLLAFDVIFVQNAHSGRMDLVALAFTLGSYHQHLCFKPTQVRTLLVALLGTLAVLTTLRIAVLVFPFFALLFFNHLRLRQWRNAILLPVTSVVLYAIWIWWGFGSIGAFIEEYMGKSSAQASTQSLASGFVGGNFNIPFYQFPMVSTGVISIIILLKTCRTSQTLWLFLLPIISFYLLVKDTGAYSAMVVPFWYGTIALAASQILQKQFVSQTIPRMTWLCLGLLLFINTGIFATKSMTILAGKSERDPKAIEAWVAKTIPPHCKIVGDDRYFYACLSNHCSFQYLDRLGTPDERARYHLENFRPDYLFASTQTPKEVLDAYGRYYTFYDTLRYVPATSMNQWALLPFKLPIQISSSYEGMVIRLEAKQVGDFKIGN